MSNQPTNQKELKDLTPQEKETLRAKLTENVELLELQARAAEARMRLLKANFEHIMYAARLADLQNPTPDESDATQSDRSEEKS
jgi:hypothetical protein